MILSLVGEFKAVSDAGLMAGNLDTGGTGWSDPATAQAFTFDGAAVTQLGITGFTVNAINSTGVIAGAVTGRGALFHDGQLIAAGPGPLSALNSAAVAAGAFAAYQQSSVFLWDGSEHDLPGLWLANDIDDAGTVAGALDSGGRCTGRAHCDYQPRLHAAIASGGIVEDLNFLVDTSTDPTLVWHELSSAVALDDGGRVLVVFDNGMSAVLEPLPR